MAIISCPECKKAISDKASICPYCGCPSNEWQGSMKTTDIADDENSKQVKNINQNNIENSDDNVNYVNAISTNNPVTATNKNRGCVWPIISIFIVILGVILYFTVIKPQIQKSGMEKNIKKIFENDVVLILPDAELDKVNAQILKNIPVPNSTICYAAYTMEISSDRFSEYDPSRQLEVVYNLFESFIYPQPFEKYLYKIKSTLYCFPYRKGLILDIESKDKMYTYSYSDLYVETQNNSSSFESVSSSDSDFWYAISAAQGVVKTKLVSPSTAKFPISESEYAVRKKEDQWEVSGYVDAQNSFGATIRQNWTATFTLGSTSGEQYKVSNFSVDIE